MPVPRDEVVDKEFMQFLIDAENPRRVGFKDGRYHSFRVPGSKSGEVNIGIGHFVDPENSGAFRNGLSEDETMMLLFSDAIIAKNQARDEIDAQFGEGRFDSLSPRQRKMFTDLSFNMGPGWSRGRSTNASLGIFSPNDAKRGKGGFPTFTNAILKGDWDTAKKNFERTGLRARNKLFRTRFLEPEIANSTLGAVAQAGGGG